MAAKITFTQKEQDQLETVCITDNYPELEKLLEKMKKSRGAESVKFHGVGVAKVLEIARDKFGERFKTPPMMTKEWTIKMQRAINDSGVTEETARKAIENCDWQNDVFAQTLIYKLAELAVVKNTGRQGKLFNKPNGPAAPSKKSVWLGQLDTE